jgi:hypothetical protein
MPRKLCLTGMALLLVITITGCNTNSSGLTGSGKDETREFAFSGFTAVEADNAFEVSLNQGGSYSIKVTTDDNLWDFLDISLEGGTLHFGIKKGTSITAHTLKAEVVLPHVTGLIMTGAASGVMSGFSSEEKVTFNLSGASEASVAGLKTTTAVFDISGGSYISGDARVGDAKFVAAGIGRVELTGSAVSASIDASGASDIRLGNFAVKEMSIVLRQSQATVNAEKINLADLGDNSHAYYLGSPTLSNVQTRGGSTIEKIA